jgi:LmbE family N-acetylglucosaminyl deacetylase
VTRFIFAPPDPTPLRILCIGAHSDDIEIGCGAAVLRLLREHPGARVTWVVFAASDEREKEARASAADFLARAERPDIRLHAFPDAHFPAEYARVKAQVEALKPLEPHVIFTHCRHDLHQDHRLLCELTWNAFRDHVILEYEVPKYDADLTSPNVFFPIETRDARRKTELLMKHFATQRAKHWFDEALFMGLMRIRGVECRSPSGLAEAFHARKIVL